MTEQHTLWSVARPGAHRFSLVSEYEELRLEAQATANMLGGEFQVRLETRELTLDELKELAQVVNTNIDAVERELEAERLDDERQDAERAAYDERRRYTHPVILGGSAAKNTVTEFEGTLHLRSCRHAPDWHQRGIAGLWKELSVAEARSLVDEFDQDGHANLAEASSPIRRTLVALKVCKVCKPLELRTGDTDIDLDGSSTAEFHRGDPIVVTGGEHAGRAGKFVEWKDGKSDRASVALYYITQAAGGGPVIVPASLIEHEETK